MPSQLLLINRLKDLVLFKAQDKSRVWINDAARNFFRLSDNYVEIETFHQQLSNAGLIHVADLQMLQQKFAYADKGELKPSFTIEVRLRPHGDEPYIWHQVNASFIQDDGMEAGWIFFCRDVQPFKDVQDMFQLVLDNIPEGIFWKDTSSRYLGCNRQFARDAGIKMQDIIGRDDYALAWKTSESDYYRAWDRKVMESGKPEYHIIETQLQSDGKQAWVDTNKIPLTDTTGKVIGILGLYEDITERVKKEKQLEDFVATLTHDLKNPILGTNRVLELIAADRFGAISQELKEIIIQIKSSNGSLLRMIQSLTDVYRYDSVSGMIDRDLCDVSEILRDCVRQFEVGAQTKNIEINCNCPKSAEARVNAEGFRRVLQNLLDNALKFTPDGGSIFVTLEVDLTQCVVRVSDTGKGISQEDQDHLFHRFWQGTPGKKYSQGTGLGLYLCKQIVEAHRGTITSSSIEGQGATFIVSIPLATE